MFTRFFAYSVESTCSVTDAEDVRAYTEARAAFAWVLTLTGFGPLSVRIFVYDTLSGEPREIDEEELANDAHQERLRNEPAPTLDDYSSL